MRTINIKLLADGVSVSDDILGRAGEKNVVQLSIDFDALRDSGLTTATVLFHPPGAPALPMDAISLPLSGALLVTVPEWAMPARGTTQVQLSLEGDDIVARSYVWNMRVMESLINRGEMPQPVQDWLNEMGDATKEANVAADRANDAADNADRATDAANDAAERANAAADGVIADLTTGLTQIQQAAATAEDNVIAQGELVKASIPADYTALSETVDEIHADYAPAIVESAEGEVIVAEDSAERGLRGLRVFGKTTQDGVPTPEAPVPLVSVGDDGEIEVTAAGKNLAHITQDSVQSGYYLDGTGEPSNPDSRFVRTYLRVLPNTQYVLQSNLSIYSVWYANGATRLRKVSSGNVRTIGITTKDNENRLYITLNNTSGIADTSAFEWMQLELGSTATPYEPYKPITTLPLSTPNGLPGIPVDSGGNYTDADGQQWICDEVDLERGVLVQRVKRDPVTTTGRAFFTSSNGAHIYYPMYDCVADMSAPGWCSHAAKTKWGDAPKGSVAFGTGEHGAVAFSTKDFATIDELRLWIKANSAEVIMLLATPIETPLSASEIAAYKAMLSRKPTTTVYNDAGAHMAVDYVADTKTWINNKFAALSAAIVNNA